MEHGTLQKITSVQQRKQGDYAIKVPMQGEETGMAVKILYSSKLSLFKSLELCTGFPFSMSSE